MKLSSPRSNVTFLPDLQEIKYYTKIYYNCYNTSRDNTLNKIIMPERRQSHPKAPTGLNDETAEKAHDIIHNAEVEEQKV